MAQHRHPSEIEADETAVKAILALERLANHACCWPPNCGHQRFSECRNALVAAIKKETRAVLKVEGRE